MHIFQATTRMPALYIWVVVIVAWTNHPICCEAELWDGGNTHPILDTKGQQNPVGQSLSLAGATSSTLDATIIADNEAPSIAVDQGKLTELIGHRKAIIVDNEEPSIAIDQRKLTEIGKHRKVIIVDKKAPNIAIDHRMLTENRKHRRAKQRKINESRNDLDKQIQQNTELLGHRKDIIAENEAPSIDIDHQKLTENRKHRRAKQRRSQSRKHNDLRNSLDKLTQQNTELLGHRKDIIAENEAPNIDIDHQKLTENRKHRRGKERRSRPRKHNDLRNGLDKLTQQNTELLGHSKVITADSEASSIAIGHRKVPENSKHRKRKQRRSRSRKHDDSRIYLDKPTQKNTELPGHSKAITADSEASSIAIDHRKLAENRKHRRGKQRRSRSRKHDDSRNYLDKPTQENTELLGLSRRICSTASATNILTEAVNNYGKMVQIATGVGHDGSEIGMHFHESYCESERERCIAIDISKYSSSCQTQYRYVYAPTIIDGKIGLSLIKIRAGCNCIIQKRKRELFINILDYFS